MYTKLKKINEGFTIVETLIVLAIAALIITIVLIAVPDLQRASRNTNILHDAQNVASGVQSFEGNNDGALPTNATGAVTPNAQGVITIGTTGAEATAHVQVSDSIYWATGSTAAVTYTTNQANASATKIGPGQIFVDQTADCGTTGNSQTPTADTRGVAGLLSYRRYRQRYCSW